MDALEFTRGERITKHFVPRKTVDGTLFCVKYGNESSIYVFHNGMKVAAVKSWNGDIKYSECFGNALYFLANDKIYKTTFHQPNHIRIVGVRDYEQEEEPEGCNMLFSRVRERRQYVYRACDNPNYGIEVNVHERQLRGCTARAIHRGKLIYTKLEEFGMQVRAASKNIIIIQHDSCINNVYANDDSPFVYFACYKQIWVLNTGCSTMDFFSLNTSVNGVDEQFYYVVGVHGGNITAIDWDSERYLFTAPLPKNIRENAELDSNGNRRVGAETMLRQD